jgi:hypothetical protein
MDHSNHRGRWLNLTGDNSDFNTEGGSGSNLCLHTNYHGLFIGGFLQSIRAEYLTLGNERFLSHPFQFIIHWTLYNLRH